MQRDPSYSAQYSRSTVGKIASDLLLKSPDSRDPIELQREMQKEYLKELEICVNNHKNQYLGDFYVEVITKKERILENVLRNYFFATKACPTPNYDQTLFFFDRSSETLLFLWVIPDRETSIIFLQNGDRIVPEERQLLQFVTHFADGTLMRICKERNGEPL